MKDRVKQVMLHFDLKQKEFANELCVAEATISSIYKGRTAPSNNLIQAVHQAFPSVNINWLMFGEGEMLLPLSGNNDQSGAAIVQSPESGQNVGFEFEEGPSLFDTGTFVPATPSVPQATAARTAQVDLKLAEALLQMKNAKDIDKPVRKIKEIRVFYDDGTFEAFTPSGK